MRAARWLNHALIVLFAVASGTFKVLGGKADLDVFSHLGMSGTAIAVFGVIQALAGVGLVFAATVRASALVVAACHALATAGLFAAGVQPFGWISIAFVAMALAELGFVGRRGPFAALDQGRVLPE